MVRSSTTTSSLQMRCRISSREKIVPRWAMSSARISNSFLVSGISSPPERADLAPEVHLQLFEPDAVFGRLRRGGASQHAAHAGQHLAHGEGFGYVVVGPEVEPRHGVVFVVPGRAEDHRDIRRLGFVLSICAIRNPLISPIITSSRMSE